MLVKQNTRALIADMIAKIPACDSREELDKAQTLEWIASGEPLFRLRPPAEPPRHLAVYFALFDDEDQSVMMIDHVKAQCWLLPGGHVDPDEDPRVTATREAEEELQVDAAFHPRFGSDPLLLSVTRTRGAGSHTDVTLWFVMHGRRSDPITADPRECNGVRWFPLQGTDWRRDDFDPQMHRFVSKLTTPPSHW